MLGTTRMRDPKSVRNRSNNGANRGNGSPAADGAGRAGRGSRLSLYRRAERLATLLAFTVVAQVILVAGDLPLGVELGEQCPRDYYARTAFECDDLDRADAAPDAQGQFTKRVESGALILDKGARVRRQHLVELEAERESFSRTTDGLRVRYQRLGGLLALLLVLAGATGLYIAKYRPDLMHSRAQRLAFGLLTLAVAGVARMFVVMAVPAFLAPVPLAVMVLCLVYDQRLGFGMAAVYALLAGVAGEAQSIDFAVLMLGGMTAALLTGNVRTRTTLLKVGLVSGCAQWIAALGLGLLAATGPVAAPLKFWESPMLLNSLCAFGNGLASGFLISGLLPVIERLFGVTTDIRLLEWSNPNQPLLQRLLREAPGTYHHSLLVGSLAADAAESIGANPLLTRVSAYFHDIGKLKNPEYFGENLPQNGQNPHDDLPPMMSRLVITAHPRDGAEMAAQEGVPREVRDIILESHGSTTVKYFWGRAQDQSGEQEGLNEGSFRYRLPKPHTPEAACVMLSDSVESAARSLKAPTPGKIEDLVHTIILDRLHDGQLDESGISVTDVRRIEDTLVRGLNAVYHTRVRYPDQAEEQMREVPAEEDVEAPDTDG